MLMPTATGPESGAQSPVSGALNVGRRSQCSSLPLGRGQRSPRSPQRRAVSQSPNADSRVRSPMPQMAET